MTETTILDAFDGWPSDDMASLILDSIFDDAAFKVLLKDEAARQGVALRSYQDVLVFLRLFFRDAVGWQQSTLRHEVAVQIPALAEYERRVEEVMHVYEPAGKPNPDALFWPNPTRDPASTLDATLPYVEKHDLVSKETPVGSAGSCFAFEIAYELQDRGFNYVTKEVEQDPEAGVLIGDHDPAVSHARFPANWGQLFNTPSFSQLAERAFGLRQLPRILVKTVTPEHGDTIYADPFREGVWFASPEAYEANYDRHTEAARQALVECRVFIITLGLNECWEFVPDGSVLARNPRNRVIQSMLKSRVLTVEENVANVQRFIDIVRENNPEFTLLISVSPVPLMATTRAHDTHVIAANAHSKAVLRVAAEILVANNRDVHYFPSYEVVTTCSDTPWKEDQRHVSPQAVQQVMRLFDAMYVVEKDVVVR
jgi:hypothetical protein